MTARVACLSLSIALAAGGAVSASDTQQWVDAAADAVARPTDPGADDAYFSAALPDLLSLRISGWNPAAPATDPWSGQTIDGEVADIMRIDLVLSGLQNPPGPLGLGPNPFDPDRFGDRPVYGFVELNVDRSDDTGGELGSAAALRYLANVGRFARRPHDSIGGRMAVRGGDVDGLFATSPQYERSGAEFDFGFCGCSDSVLVSETGDNDGVMDPGEVFIVRGRFFRRVAAFASVSGMEGGSYGGLYDPLVEVRFEHDAALDQTTVSLVFALTMEGAAALAGQPVQSPDFLVDNHASVEEALWDVIDGAEGFNGTPSAEVATLISGWSGRTPGSYLDPTRWRASALVGTTYQAPGQSQYVWTDTGFEETIADYTGDSMVTAADHAAFDSYLAANDGGPEDADGAVNGVIVVPEPGPGFDAHDITGDGAVDSADRAAISVVNPADLSGDGVVDGADLGLLLGQWGGPGAGDLNADGIVDGADLGLLLGSWG